ncbi:ParB/RepB/Spo0J family partition protein [Ferruginibacter sp.]
MIQNKLDDIPVDLIEPNPDNPRIVFRQSEMDQLLVSIKKYGIQVPITLFRNKGKYILIDGERRWRTAKKLNLKTIPAIIQDKPDQLENLLMMFNIHSLREQWDLFTIANKLTTVIELLHSKNSSSPTETQISEYTGLSRSTIRRCKLLIELPNKYKDMILVELEKPKPKQKLTEDFFIEMESSLKTVKNNFPNLLTHSDNVRDNLIRKYQDGTINNVVHFRQIAKLATAPKNVSYSKKEAASALKDIFSKNKVSIEDVYKSTVGALYDEKKTLSTLKNALIHVENITQEDLFDNEIVSTLKKLHSAISKIIDGL